MNLKEAKRKRANILGRLEQMADEVAAEKQTNAALCQCGRPARHPGHCRRAKLKRKSKTMAAIRPLTPTPEAAPLRPVAQPSPPFAVRCEIGSTRINIVTEDRQLFAAALASARRILEVD